MAAPRGVKTLDGAVKATLSEKTPLPLVGFVTSQPAESQASLWDQAIGQLWQRYEREMAAQVIMIAASDNEAKILQYWIKQVLEIEPEIAREQFTPEFMRTSFRPEVASSCGRCGCK
jgi:hypothetical protein